MSIQPYHISLVLEVLLNKIDYSVTYRQEEIERDPYAAIEKALLLYIAEKPYMKNKASDLLSEIKSLSGKSIDKILENDDDKKLILKSIQELRSYIN